MSKVSDNFFNSQNRMQYYFIFSKSQLLLQRQADGTHTIPCGETAPITTKPWTHIMDIAPIGDDIEARTFNVDTPEKIEVKSKELYESGYDWIGLRETFYHLPLNLYLTAGKCQELLYWDHNTKYCGVCGAPMKMHTAISKRCTECGKEVWPQLATAVIVLIHRGDEVLLVHAKNFKNDFYGLVAGFVETGETLEEAVEREVLEETGIRVNNIRYFGSQPWPYPCGLMVGYNADYVSGDIHLQASEISKGNWFRYDNLPRIPQKLSIARQLLDAWLGEYGIVSEQE